MKLAFSNDKGKGKGKTPVAAAVAVGIVPLPSDLKSDSPRAMFCRIGPLEARRLLAINTANRLQQPKRVSQYAADMAAGRFGLSNDAISIYTTGALGTGQHRAQAVLDSGKTIDSLVLLGLPIESAADLDRPAVRQGADNLHIAGGLRGMKVDTNSRDVAVARAFVGISSENLSMRALQGVLGRYAGPLQFVKVHGPRGRQVGNAQVLSAIAAAYMAGVPREVLERFCAVLDSGIPANDEEDIIVRVRDKLKTLRGSMKHRAEARRTAMKGIALFAAGQNPSRLVVPDDNLYPLGTLDGDRTC